MRYENSKPAIYFFINAKGDHYATVPSTMSWFKCCESDKAAIVKSGAFNVVYVGQNGEQYNENCSGRAANIDSGFAQSIKDAVLRLRRESEPLDDKHIYRHPVVSIGSKCNLPCSYCYMGTPSLKAMSRFNSFETIRDFVDFCYSESGGEMRTIQIFGGEPLLHPNLKEIISHCLNLNVKVRVSTNAAANRIRSDDMLPFVKNSDVEWRVSLDSITPASHEKYRGRGTHKSIMANIDYLREHNAKVSIKPVLRKDTLPEFEEYLTYAYERGFPVSYAVLEDEGDAVKNDVKSHIQHDEVLSRILEIYSRRPELISVLKPSVFGQLIVRSFVKNSNALSRFYAYLHHDGNVYPMDGLLSEEFLIGEGAEFDFAKIEELHGKIARKRKSCSDCAIEPFCHRVGYYGYDKNEILSDSEFSCCAGKRKSFLSLMSLNEEGSKIAKSMLDFAS